MHISFIIWNAGIQFAIFNYEQLGNAVGFRKTVDRINNARIRLTSDQKFRSLLSNIAVATHSHTIDSLSFSSFKLRNDKQLEFAALYQPTPPFLDDRSPDKCGARITICRVLAVQIQTSCASGNSPVCYK